MADVIVGSIPISWEPVTLAEICERGGGNIQTGPFGSQLHASDYVAVGVPSVMPQDIGDNVIREDSIARITSNDASRLSRYLLDAGDIVYSRRGDVERRALVRSGQSGWLCGTGCLRIRPGVEVYSPYLSYYLGHPAVRQWIKRHAVGATMPNLNTKILGSVPVAIPPFWEQKAIGGVLGALEAKIAANEQIAQTSLELAESYYKYEAEISDGWSGWPLKEVAKWLSGGTPKTSEPSYWGGDIPWISAASLKTPWLYESERSLTPLGVENGTRLVPKGAILFVVRGMSLTSEFRIGIAQREVAFGQDCKALVPKQEFHSASLFLAIKTQSDKILEMVDLAGHGTGRLVTERISKLIVRLPQGESAAEFSKRIGSLVDTSIVATLENRALVRLRNTLLPQLISGKLRVRDAERIVEDAV